MWVHDGSSDYNPENPGLSGWVSNVNKGPHKKAVERETQGHMELKQGAADSPGGGGRRHWPRNEALEARKGDRTEPPLLALALPVLWFQPWRNCFPTSHLEKL